MLKPLHPFCKQPRLHSGSSGALESESTPPSCQQEHQLPSEVNLGTNTTHGTTSSGTSRAQYPCPECDVVFGKRDKLEKHLQRHHNVVLSLPSDVLAGQSDSHLGDLVVPSASISSEANFHQGQINEHSPTLSEVKAVLTTAVAEANTAFDSGLTFCRLCIPTRSFLTRKDLAKHFVSKHTNSMCKPAPSVPSDPLATQQPTTPSVRSSVSPKVKQTKQQKAQRPPKPNAVYTHAGKPDSTSVRICKRSGGCGFVDRSNAVCARPGEPINACARIDKPIVASDCVDRRNKFPLFF